MTTRLSMIHHSSQGGNLNGNLLLKFPAHYDNKYVIFYSLWPCCFIPSLNLVAYRRMFCFVILILIMAGFNDNEDFSLSGLMQKGHDFVTVIESSSSDDENYYGLLDVLASWLEKVIKVPSLLLCNVIVM